MGSHVGFCKLLQRQTSWTVFVAFADHHFSLLLEESLFGIALGTLGLALHGLCRLHGLGLCGIRWLWLWHHVGTHLQVPQSGAGAQVARHLAVCLPQPHPTLAICLLGFVGGLHRLGGLCGCHGLHGLHVLHGLAGLHGRLGHSWSSWWQGAGSHSGKLGKNWLRNNILIKK